MYQVDVIRLAEFPEYSVRVKQPEGLCDTSVKQYSGYLDISAERHLFFWFFESRSKPATDPVVLWLNGGEQINSTHFNVLLMLFLKGPGCSSTTGLLFELGPCTVRNGGNETEYNEWSWNSNANTLFLDQPVNVGYSYSSESVNTTPDAAKDVYAFLQLFFNKFTEYNKQPFHISGESYAGHYSPHFGRYVYEENKKLAKRNALGLASTTSVLHIPLESLLIGNGLTEPLTQFASVPDWGCAPSPTAVFDESTCTGIRGKVPTCERLQAVSCHLLL